jgi:hypothetical protein
MFCKRATRRLRCELEHFKIMFASMEEKKEAKDKKNSINNL